jgi:Ca2+-binding RTX toxin-like protein
MSARSFRRQHERTMERDRKRAGRRSRSKAFAAAAGAAVGATVVFAPGASAATFTVDTNVDEAVDAQRCADDDCTLREAAVAANETTGADAITFAPSVTGTIALSTSLGQINLYNDAVDIQGPGADVLTISGQNDDGIFKLFGFDAEGTPVRIAGLTLANGEQTTGGAAINNYAGGDFAADLTVADSKLLDNTANSGSGASGGAIRSLYGDLTIVNSQVSGNYAYYDGGGVFVDEGTLTITGSEISNNTAYSEGGGIAVDDTPGGATDVRIADSTVSGNESLDDEGGGVYLDSIDGGAVIERSTLSGNTAYNEGGGIYVDGATAGSVTVESSTFSGNDAQEGAGIYLDEVDESVAVRNSTLSGNRALYEGGGIFIDSDTDNDENIAIRNSTLSGNSATDVDAAGGGVYEYVLYTGGIGYVDDVLLSSTIVANNSADRGPDVAQGEDPIDEGAISAAFSLIETTGAAAINSTGPNLTGVDPQLGPLQNNGGPTQTHAPSFGSPVIDKGVGNGLGTDQRGAPRTFDAANVANAAGGDGTDVGSVELLPGNKLSLAQCKGATENILFAPGAAIIGTDGNDVIVGTSANDEIKAGKGADLICAGGGNDNAKGEAGKDRVLGEAGKDTVGGNGGKDNVKGGGGKDKIKGGGGKDKLAGQAGADTLKGGGGADTLKGGGGGDTLKGGGGGDTLKGGPGKDKLRGGPGTDTLKGGGGKDSEVQ